jgi:hypothetical protein
MGSPDGSTLSVYLQIDTVTRKLSDGIRLLRVWRNAVLPETY